ncbi:hypothetical protein [Lachnospira multipara]|uniref:hypothetical protein n=1 Tax=Lachnospira multipara TaxID=28051 RepID=UPI0004851853|nr:hypothetical protein [Lachnospira multipara]
MRKREKVYTVGVIELVNFSNKSINYRVGIEKNGVHKRLPSIYYQEYSQILSEGDVVDVAYNERDKIVSIIDDGLIPVNQSGKKKIIINILVFFPLALVLLLCML